MKRIYWGFLLLVPAVSLLILAFLKGSFTRLIDFATALSFLSSPILGWYNLKLITSKLVPEAARPGRGYVLFSWLMIAFLVVFSGIYLYWRYFAG